MLIYPVLCFCDLDLDPMILLYELDLDILKIPETNFLGQDFQKLQHEQDRHRDRHTDVTEFITTSTFAGGD